MMDSFGDHVVASKKGSIAAVAYPGDGCVLLAFDLAADKTENFAGFAIKRKAPDRAAEDLLNRLSFDTSITTATTPLERRWTPSSLAPFQHFRWVDFPSELKEGRYVYTVTAMYFKDKSGALVAGDATDVEVELGSQPFDKFKYGFTRGYMSSQAYAARFANAAIRPSGPKAIAYDTKPFAKQYEWLGGSARKLLMQSLEDFTDKHVTVDMFAFDLDEPDFIKTLTTLGPRLRVYLDDSQLHTKPGCAELQAREKLLESAGPKNVRVGHFRRFAHNKVLVFKRDGVPYKVLTGSANFSVRGLYVQANNVLVYEDPAVAKLYADAFEQAFDAPTDFAHSEIAEGWHPLAATGIPASEFAFSPHTSAEVSLERVADAIRQAKGSVLFAVMELGGKGPVLESIHELDARSDIFGYGVTQSMAGLNVYKPSSPGGTVVPFAYLRDKTPPPFDAEISGGPGQVIHHKFVVVDFNGKAPAVFTGSSNLAAGGETSNGDNLVMLTDPRIVTAFAVEAVRLVDHYHFRVKMKDATDVKPLKLQGPVTHGAWWEPYYDRTSLKYHERQLFSGRG